ncbi:MAG: TrkA C-terminal domain-containing protein [Clostridiaceae bacterium]|nr:TrkA C-terminal domain-containing protein [Clostridiaceae bacterium]
MSEPEVPQYMLIASDLSARIARGEFPEDRRISGRTILSSEYGVSPETIRRALALLADMKVVSIRHNSGFYILSRDNARRYLNEVNHLKEQRSMQGRFKELMEQQQAVNAELLELAGNLAKAQSTLSFVKNNFPTYETGIPEDSFLCGQNIGALRFWQHTGATIVAIRRAQNVILSPGPYAELYAGDVLLYVGEPGVQERVGEYIGSHREAVVTT